MEYRSPDVMAYVLYFCKHLQAEPIYVNRSKAQQFLYCCYGTVLAAFDKRLTDEHPRKWPFGPVFPRTFDAINHNRLTVGMARDFQRHCSENHPGVVGLIDRTVTTFAKYSVGQLCTWSCRRGWPWDKADDLAALDDRAIMHLFAHILPVVDPSRTNVKLSDPDASAAIRLRP